MKGYEVEYESMALLFHFKEKHLSLTQNLGKSPEISQH